MSFFTHNLSDIQSKNIGDNTTIWQFVVVLKNAIIGKNCNICSHVFIENKVEIGDSVTIKCGVQIWDGIKLKDHVFIGPNVTFTNDLSPRSKGDFKIIETTINKGASIGANATIIAGNNIGDYAMVGAGSVVTKNIKNNELWIGNPAKHVGYITIEGEILDLNLVHKKSKEQYKWNKTNLIKSDD
ncbi:acyltransferase [Mariniflexile sp. AS56]|uniref:acyltransferase n=1 Tax=Mariniflexile sp. AS56 TaxID=3063957 RepID=UPI0026F2137A|nr:acyltransferase [Mariniflexile sp. AS56]MDO7171374.1 acyltransferase [Mariniflexile sp. AS56]